MRTNLAANVSKRLYFAGEATEKTNFATAHGAYLSGVRAANEILTG
jgi:predicted NAD/FAD-dependent oxidoreductase